VTTIITYCVAFNDKHLSSRGFFQLEANFAIADADGNWKHNTYILKAPKACSSYKSIMGSQWNTYWNGFGLKNATCPIPPVK